MTVVELLEILAELEPDVEVRIMAQPSYPFEYRVSDVWDPADSGFEPDSPPDAGVVYLTEGRQMGYGTKEAW